MAKFRDSEVHEKSEVGLVTGLAWTEVGGSILTTEVQVLDGKGKLTITGQLGRRDAGVGAGGAELHSRQGAGAGA